MRRLGLFLKHMFNPSAVCPRCGATLRNTTVSFDAIRDTLTDYWVSLAAAQNQLRVYEKQIQELQHELAEVKLNQDQLRDDLRRKRLTL